MKNKEKYAVEIACKGGYIGVDKHTGVVRSCFSLICCECLFNASRNCDKARANWAESEYVEPPVISKSGR